MRTPWGYEGRVRTDDLHLDEPPMSMPSMLLAGAIVEELGFRMSVARVAVIVAAVDVVDVVNTSIVRNDDGSGRRLK